MYLREVISQEVKKVIEGGLVFFERLTHVFMLKSWIILKNDGYIIIYYCAFFVYSKK